MQISAVIAQYRGQRCGGPGVDGVLHIGQAQPKALQAGLIDFHHHHRVQPSGDRHAADFIPGQQVFLQFLGQRLQRLAVGIAVQLQPQRVLLALGFLYHRISGVCRKRGDGIDLRFYVQQQRIEIVVGLLFHCHCHATASRGAGYTLDTGYALKLFLDLHRQSFLRQLGRAAVEADGDTDGIGLDTGKGLPTH